MPRKVLIAVIGSSKDHKPAISNASELGKLIAEKGWVVITGGRDAGVMHAANEGAKAAKDSITIGILPNRDVTVSAAVDVAIVTDTGEARNNIIVLSADVVVACDASDPGTASEVALAIKNEKQVLLLGANEEARAFFTRLSDELVTVVDSPEDAIAMITSILEGRAGVATSHE